MKYQFNRALSFVKANPLTTGLLVLALAAVLWYFRGSISQAWQSHQVNREDAKLEKSIEQKTKAAESSETNANSHRDDRLEAEGRAVKAWEEKEAAATNSRRTVDPVRKARQRYEETRRSPAADAPALSDSDICAELAKRNIPCH